MGIQRKSLTILLTTAVTIATTAIVHSKRKLTDRTKGVVTTIIVATAITITMAIVTIIMVAIVMRIMAVIAIENNGNNRFNNNGYDSEK